MVFTIPHWTLRTCTFGAAGIYDPSLIFCGSRTYAIYGEMSSSVTGMMSVSGTCPRIYVRDSLQNHDFVPSNTLTWKIVEITFYSNTIDPGIVPVVYAGVQADARTDHYPDTDLCNMRGISTKWNFDGRCQFEKETGNKQVNTTYAFPNNGPIPLK